MEVRTAEVVHRKSSLALRLFLTVGDEQRERERSAFTLSRGGIPLKSSAAGVNIGFLHGPLDLSHEQSRTVVRSISFGRVSANPT